MKKIVTMRVLYFIIISIIALAGCTGNQAITEPSDSEPDQVTATQPVTVDLPEPSETAITAETPEPTEIAESITDDIQDFLYNYSYQDIEQYNVFFEEETEADLDGDGDFESVKLLREGPKIVEGDKFYTSFRILINDKELLVTSEPNYNIGSESSIIYGIITDIYKNDGKKEIMVFEQRDYGFYDEGLFEKAFIITYTNNEPQIIQDWEAPIEATGTGYIVNTVYSKVLKGGYSIGLLAISRYSPGTGFEELKTDKYRTQFYTGQPGEYTVETYWDQMVAEVPGEEEGILIKTGSQVYFGLYDPLGWIEVYDANDKRLGWLDLNEVDIDKYIYNALNASCH